MLIVILCLTKCVRTDFRRNLLTIFLFVGKRTQNKHIPASSREIPHNQTYSIISLAEFFWTRARSSSTADTWNAFQSLCILIICCFCFAEAQINHLQRLQDRARTLIESSNVKDGWTCNWLSVSNLIKYDKAVMAYKIMNNLCPNSLQGKFTMRSQISAYVTRNCRDIDIPKRNLEFSKKSFLYSGAKLWNDIPLDIRNSPTVLTFKKKLKDYLLH